MYFLVLDWKWKAKVIICDTIKEYLLVMGKIIFFNIYFSVLDQK